LNVGALADHTLHFSLLSNSAHRLG
jgi:hypothetical protein